MALACARLEPTDTFRGAYPALCGRHRLEQISAQHSDVGIVGPCALADQKGPLDADQSILCRRPLLLVLAGHAGGPHQRRLQ